VSASPFLACRAASETSASAATRRLPADLARTIARRLIEAAPPHDLHGGYLAEDGAVPPGRLSERAHRREPAADIVLRSPRPGICGS